MRFVIFFACLLAGFLIIWKTQWLIAQFGRVAWAERKLGSGGTWTFYKLLGLGIIFVGFLILTGGIFSVLDGLFAR